jgi:hypothetical protein
LKRPGFLNPKKKLSAARMADRVLLLGLGVAFAYWIFASLIFALTAESGSLRPPFFQSRAQRGAEPIAGALLFS